MAYQLPPASYREQEIRRLAAKWGIDPDVAVRVAKREGLKDGVWQSNVINKKGKRETSYGDLQMLTGGGLGDEFERATKLKASDPRNWLQLDDFALMKASQGGWKPWYGAKAAGVTGMMGIGGRPAGTQLALGNDHPKMGDQPYIPGGYISDQPPPEPQGILASLFAPNANNKDNQSQASKIGGILSQMSQMSQQAPAPLPKMDPIQNAKYQPLGADVMMDYGGGGGTDEEEELKKLLAGMGGM
jgi:hypothetical protein